jgi:hypothetical protein
MTNAKEEFIKEVGNKIIHCAKIVFDDFTIPKQDNTYILTTGWDSKDLEDFLDSINFEYDSGYGSQKLYGNIWYVDGTWSERGEYDGSEWWVYTSCPEIPKEVIRLDKVRNNKLNDLGI